MAHLMTFVFKSNNYGYGSAMGWIYFVIIFIILGLVFLVFQEKYEHDRRKGGSPLSELRMSIVSIAAKLASLTKPKWKLASVKRVHAIVGTILYYTVLLSLLLRVSVSTVIYGFQIHDAIAGCGGRYRAMGPKKLSFNNYVEAFNAIHYWKGFTNSVINTLGSAILQIISCSFIGYGFARYRFPGYVLWVALLVFTFLVPPQTIVVPLFMFFSSLGWINTHYPFVIPALFGHGLKGALFVLIFIQFYWRISACLRRSGTD